MSASARERLSLCMILRDEEEMLPGCLESVSGVVDEIIAVDTGSSDGTPDIVRSFGGTLIRHAWGEDFSAARNVSIEAATGDWILWMDADERLRPEEHDRIRRLLHGAAEDAFTVPIRSETPTGAQFTRAHRLFRNHKGIRFSGRIHEQVSPSLSRIRARVGAADFTIEHLGYNLSPERLRQKHERNLRLLTAAKRQDPRDAYVRFCLGQALMLLGDGPAAEKEVRAALGEDPSERLSNPLPDDIRSAALNNLAQCALERGRPEEALRRSAESLRIGPDQVTAHLMAYRAQQALGQEAPALRELVAADRLLDGPSRAQSAIEVTVDRAELWQAMGQSQLQLGQTAQARQSFQRVLAARGRKCERTLAALARCAIADNALAEALDLAREASALAPEDESLMDLLCFVLLKQSRFSEAAEVLRRLAGLRPGDKVLRRRLAGVLIKAGYAPESAIAEANIDSANPAACGNSFSQGLLEHAAAQEKI